MQAIRDYGSPSKPATVPKSEGSEVVHQAPGLYDLEATYQAHIKSILAQEDFASLETEVRDARLRQTRAQGGAWKLYLFYEAVASPLSDKQSTDPDWQSQFAVLKKWIAARPDSAAAHIALAEAYVNYAWRARGDGYANTVSHYFLARSLSRFFSSAMNSWTSLKSM